MKNKKRSQIKFIYKLKKRGVIQMIEDEKTAKKLDGYFDSNVESFVINTKRGHEVGHLLSQSQIKEVVRGDVLNLFADICMEGFEQQEISLDFYNDVVNHFKDCDAMSIVLHGAANPRGIGWQVQSPCYDWTYKRIGAFCTHNVYEYRGKKILYFGGIMVYPDLQNLNYGCSLIQYVMNKIKPDYLALRTQNPQMYASFRKTGDIYPNGNKVPEKIKEIGSFIAKEVLYMSEYDEDTMTEEGTYGKCLYGKIPAPMNGVEKVFNKLNPFNGDSLIAVIERERK